MNVIFTTVPQNTFRMELEVTLTMDICHQGDDLLLSTMDQSDKVRFSFLYENYIAIYINHKK